jgi:uncharacterized protein
MRFLFELAHPKHYYQFRAVMNLLEQEGHQVKVLARDKDVLLKILEEEGKDYFIYGRHGKSLAAKVMVVPALLWTYYTTVRRFRPDWVISKASPYAALVRYVHRFRTCITPDSEVVSLTNRFVAPRADLVITPRSFTVKFGRNHRFINGFFEDCYLHPTQFEPDQRIFFNLGLNKGDTYFLLRFISWNANHDLNQFGFTAEEKIKLVAMLSPYGKVYISSEGQLPDSLKRYQIKIPASSMHSALHYAALYIGDSQTMATEAALLGTPSIRHNSFVGPKDMSNFIVLENEFGLLKNCGSFAEVERHTTNLLIDPDLKKKWLIKRSAYYEKAGDVNQQIMNHLGIKSKFPRV